MILLDENIPDDQCQLLRGWRIRHRQIGRDCGQKGMQDEQHILPLLHKLDRITFFTRDMGFFDECKCHENYCLVILAVSLNETARFIKRLLRDPSFNTKAKRMGFVIRVSSSEMRVWQSHRENVEVVDWNREP